MLRWLLIAFGLTLILGDNAFGVNFPQKVTLVLKAKASCRDAKRLVRAERLFVHCAENSPFSRAYEAVYLGHEPLQEVLGRVSSYSKVEAAAPYGEVTFSGPVDYTTP